MADFSSTKGSDFDKMAASPAAPVGLEQAANRYAEAGKLWVEGGRQGLRPWRPEESMAQAGSWYTGGRAGGTENGWNTDFYNRMIEQTNLWYDKAGREGKGSVFYEQFDTGPGQNGQFGATGVVTWDDPEKDLKFGDIFQDGEKRGNVYDTFDEHTANLMMGDFTLTREQKLKAFEEGRGANPEALKEAVAQTRRVRSEQAAFAKTAEQFQADVRSKQQEYSDSWQEGTLILGSALATGAMGAGIGTAVGGPVGTLIGTGVGAIWGGVSAYLNQDELVETAARSQALVDAANQRFKGTDQVFGGMGTWLSAYGELGSKMITPTSNTVRGVYDAQAGDVGDLTSEFWRTDSEGRRQAPGWVQLTDMGAMFADGMLQFSSGAGRSMYMATMGSITLGGVGTLATGQQFDYTQGQFRDIEGGKEWAGAVGSTAIDAVQTFTAGFIGKAARHSRESAVAAQAQRDGRSVREAADDLMGPTGTPARLQPFENTSFVQGVEKARQAATQKVSDLTMRATDKAWDVAPALGGRKDALRGWLAARENDEVLNGLRFRKDAEGAIVKVTPTLEAMVPSEFMRWLPTAAIARSMKAADAGTPSWDDFYEAALSQTRNGSRFRDAVIVGYAEGSEEAVQAVFDTMATDDEFDPMRIAQAAAMGFAGGAGMSMGRLNKRATSEQVLMNRALSLMAIRGNGRVPSDAEWAELTKGMTRDEIAKLAVATPAEDAVMGEHVRMWEEGMQRAAVESVLHTTALDRFEIQAWEKSSKRAVGTPGNKLSLRGRSGEKNVSAEGRVDSEVYPPNAMVSSVETVMQALLTNVEGLRAQVDHATRGLAEATASGDTEQQQRWQAQLDDLGGVLGVADMLVGTYANRGVLYKLYVDYRDFVPTTEQEVKDKQQMLRKFNATLARAYNGQWREDPKDPMSPLVSREVRESMRKITEVKLPRYPLTGKGSFNMFIPQASFEMSVTNEHGVATVPQSMLETMHGDHDGDDLNQAAEFYIPPDTLRGLRSGTQYVQKRTESTPVMEQVLVLDAAGNPVLDANNVPVMKEQPKLKPNGEPMESLEASWEVKIANPDSEAAMLRMFSDPLLSTDMRNKVQAGIIRLGARLRARYAHDWLVPEEQFDAAWTAFHNSVNAGNPDARKTFVEALFNANGLALLEMGEQSNVPEALMMWSMISTEWDSIAQELAYVRASDPTLKVVNPLTPAIADDSKELVARARKMFKTLGEALMSLGTVAPVRPSQIVHYDMISSLVQMPKQVAESLRSAVAGQHEMSKAYAQMGAEKTRSDLDEMLSGDDITRRILDWLQGYINAFDIKTQFPHMDSAQLLLLVANMKVPDLARAANPEVAYNGETVSLAQLLLAKSLDIEEASLRGSDPDGPQMRKVHRLRSMTRDSSDPESGHSYTAQLAIMEIFGEIPLYRLLGDAAMYLGPHMTLRQLHKLLLTKSDEDRKEIIASVQRSPYYKSGHGLGDGPWDASAFFAEDGSGELMMTPLTMLVDSLKTGTNQERARRKKAADTTLEQYVMGFRHLNNAINTFYELHRDTLDGTDRPAILRAMVNSGDERYSRLITDLIPDSAVLGIFENVNGVVSQAVWLEGVLSLENPEEAAAMMYIKVMLARWQVYRGTRSATDSYEVVKEREAEGKRRVSRAQAKLARAKRGKESRQAQKELERIQAEVKADMETDLDLDGDMGKVRFSQIDSRFLETIYYLNTLNDGKMQLRRFINTISSLKSLPEIFDAINNDPVWLFGRPPLRPFDDDRRAYELSPGDVFGGGNDQTVINEAVEAFSLGMRQLSESLAVEMVNARDNKVNLTAALDEYRTQQRMVNEALRAQSHSSTPNQRSLDQIIADVRSSRGKLPAAIMLDQLRTTIRNRQLFGTPLGQKARDQALAAFQTMFMVGHNKGVAPEQLRPLGEAVPAAAQFGFGSAWRMQMDALTDYDWAQVVNNPSLLCRGKTRIMLPDGSDMTVDFSDEGQALELLLDAATAPFAQAVLFPSELDVDQQNQVRRYNSFVNNGNVADMLQDSDFGSFFHDVPGESRLAKAHRIIGTIEGFALNAALEDGTKDAWERGSYPLTGMISQILIAYQTSAAVTASTLDQVRNELVIAVADAVMAIASVSDSDTDSTYTTLHTYLAEQLQKRFLGDAVMTQALEDLYSPGGDPNGLKKRQMDAENFRRIHLSEITEEIRAVQQDIAGARLAGDTHQVRVLEARVAGLQQQYDLVTSTPWQDVLGVRARSDYMSVHKMFALTHVHHDLDQTKKAYIVSYLSNQERISAYRGYKAKYDTVDADGQPMTRDLTALINMFQRMAYDGTYDPALDLLTREDWDQLVEFCTTTFLSERVTRGSTDLRIMPVVLGKNLDEQRKLFDLSWESLVDPLFNPYVLAGARYMRRMAGQTTTKYAPTEAADLVLSSILREDRLGPWHDRIPPLLFDAKKRLSGAAVNLGVAMGGVSNEQMGGWVATGRVSYDEPDLATATTTMNVVVPQGMELIEVLDQLAFLRLHNHFAASITVTDSTGVATDRVKEMAQRSQASDESKRSDLRVMNIADMNDWLRAQPDLAGGYTISIQYVDVHKKPADPQWANNHFFDGVGRGGVGNAEVGLIASMLYAVGGEFENAMQFPLDALTKAGKSYRAFKTAEWGEVDRIEAATSYTEIIERKAILFATSDFPDGKFTLDDMPGALKYTKSRHVLVGINPASGKKEVWTADKALMHEAAGLPIDLVSLTDPNKPARLVAISEAVAQTILGDVGFGGVEGDRQRPVTDVLTLPQQPSLNTTDLERLGLVALGETIEPRLSVFSRYNRLPQPDKLPAEDRKGIRTMDELRLEHLSKQQLEEQQRRLQLPAAVTKPQLNIADIRKKGLRNLKSLLTAEDLSSMLNTLGVPFDFFKDAVKDSINKRMAAVLESLLEKNAVVWTFKMGTVSGDLSNGTITQLNLGNDFEGSPVRPVFGDAVAIDLDSILKASRNSEDALAKAMEVVDYFTDRGLTIALTGSTSVEVLKGAVARSMLSGEYAYKRLGASTTFFTPMTTQDYVNETISAMESTLVETYPQRADTLGVYMLINDETVLSEGHMLVNPAVADSWLQVRKMLLPTTSEWAAAGWRDDLILGAPQHNTGFQAQFEQARLRFLEYTDDGDIDSPGAKELIKALGTYDKTVNHYQLHPDGSYTAGMRSPKDAVKNFLDCLKRGNHTYDVGETVMGGDLFMHISAQGDVMLARVGCKLPKVEDRGEYRRQWDIDRGVPGLRYAVAPPKLEELWTVPPPLTVTGVGSSHVTGTYALSELPKLIHQGTGNKTTSALMDPTVGFTTPLSPNGTHVTGLTSPSTTADKGGVRWEAVDYKDAFAFTGWDIQQELVEFFYGEGTPVDDTKLSSVMMALREFSKRDHGVTASGVLAMHDWSLVIGTAINRLNDAAILAIPGWQPLNADDLTGAARGTRAAALSQLMEVILGSLMVPGVTPEMLVSLPGKLTVTSGDSMVGWLPSITSKLMKDNTKPELRKFLLDKLNSVFTVITDPNTGERVLEHWFSEDLSFNVSSYRTLPDGSVKRRVSKATPQLRASVPVGQNPVTSEFDQGGPRAESPFNSRVLAGALGGNVATRMETETYPDPTDPTKKLTRVKASALDVAFGDNQIPIDFSEKGALWGMLTDVMPRDSTYTPFSSYMPMEYLDLQKQKQKMVQYLVAVDKSSTDPQVQKQWADVRVKTLEFLAQLGLGQNDVIEVDFLVRQWFGAPGPAEGQTDWQEAITPDLYSEALTGMLYNIAPGRRMHPLHGAMVPYEHSVFWNKVFQAGVWSPMRKTGRRKLEAEHDWAQWVAILLDQVQMSHVEYRPEFRLDVDGFYHTYQGASPAFNTLALSLDQEIAAKLMDPDINRHYLSEDPDVRQLLAHPAIVDSMVMTHELLVGMQGDFRPDTAEGVSRSSFAERRAYQKKWLRDNKVRPTKRKSIRDHAREGNTYQESIREGNNFLRSMVHLSVTTRLFNPALWTSALAETFFRNQIENVTTLVAGTSIGRGGTLASRLGGALNMPPKYTPEQIKMLRDLADMLGESNEFIGELFGEMMYIPGLLESSATADEEGKYKPVGGKASRTLEKSASWVSRVMNDPALGQKRKSVALRYLSAALEYMELSPNNVVSVETLVAELKRDPLWLKKTYDKRRLNPHQMGVNAVGNIRSQKNTVLGRLIMNPIESLCAQEGAGTWIGHALKIPFLFTRFNANALMYLTGLTGVDQAAAMFMHGRESPWKFGKRLVGRAADRYGLTDYEEAASEPMDFSDVIETLDLSRLFVRGAITQTFFISAALMGANMLGLGGEDEEERKRRRIATYLNLPMIYDPQSAANDFRYKDAIFLDDVPVFGTWFSKDENGRAAIVPHWVMRQFTSPLMGIVRFINTGDISNVSAGFFDAVSVLPNSAISLWRDADLAASMLRDAAEDPRVDESAKWQSFASLMVSIVGIYEKALIENQFVNGLRSAYDRYDRNPWLMPMTNPKDDGSLNRQQGSNLPQQTDALEQYQREVPVLDENGDPVIGQDGQPVMETVNGNAYATRSWGDAMAHQYAENNTTFAIISSLVTGQLNLVDSSFRRGNMVPRTQRVDIEAATDQELEAMVLARFFGAGSQDVMTLKDLQYSIKQREVDAGNWWNQRDVDAEAKATYESLTKEQEKLERGLLAQFQARDAAAGLNTPVDSLKAEAEATASMMMLGASVVKPKVGEMLTDEGHEGMFRSLMAGLITFDDPAFQGVFADQETRDRVGARILERIIQDGVDRGMTRTGAEYRADRYYWGDKNDPNSPGLRAILYSDKIPSKPYAEYNQLNATWVAGPDGKMWATPFPRSSIAQAWGLPVPAGVIAPANDSMGIDERGNAVDKVKNLNTGKASLEPVLTEGDIKPNDDILKKAKSKEYTPSKKSYGGYGYGYSRRGGYGGYGGRGYGGGGGSWGEDAGYYTRMYNFSGPTSTSADNFTMINTSNPLIRRADVRRERVSSERGRLKQWQ